MNNHEYIRKQIRSILLKESNLNQKQINLYLLNEDLDTFREAFIEPFKDVFKVAWVSMKRVLNSANRIFLSLITLRANRQLEIARAWREKDERLAGEVKQHVDRAMAGAGPGLSFAKFAFSPGLYLADAATQNVTWQSTKQFFIDTGFDEMPLINRFLDAPPQNYFAEMDYLEDKIFKGAFKATLGANVATELGKLFLGQAFKESKLFTSNLMIEQEQKEKGDAADMSRQELIQGVKQYFTEIGWFDAIEKWREEWLGERKEFLESWLNEALPIGKFVKQLGDVDSTESLQKLVDEFELKEVNVDEIKNESEKQINSILSDEEKIKDFLDESVESGKMDKEEADELLQGLNEKDNDAISRIEDSMTRIFWMGSKEDLIKELMQSTKDMKDEFADIYEEMVPKNDRSLIQNSGVGSDWVKYVDDKKREFDEAFNF